MTKLNQDISQALTKDGFEIKTIDSKLIAIKNKIKIIINKHQDVEKRADFIYILSQLPTKVAIVSGVPFSEIKKLLKYEKKETKSLFETFQKMCDKYNWYKSLSSDYDLDRNTEIKYVEVLTDSDDYFTFAFIRDEFQESFLVFNTKAKDFIDELNNIEVEHSELQTIAPNLYKTLTNP